jgi:hypothetical protein
LNHRRYGMDWSSLLNLFACSFRLMLAICERRCN